MSHLPIVGNLVIITLLIFNSILTSCNKLCYTLFNNFINSTRKSTIIWTLINMAYLPSFLILFKQSIGLNCGIVVLNPVPIPIMPFTRTIGIVGQYHLGSTIKPSILIYPVKESDCGKILSTILRI